jgi:hypothetical protein
MDEVVVVELSWAKTLDEAMAMATKVERAKRGIVLKGYFDGGKKRRGEREK